jgi:L-lactate utilization protein LutC
MSDSRDKILGQIHDTGGTPPSSLADIAFQPGPDLWQSFETFLNALGGRIIDQNELTEILNKNCVIEPAAQQILKAQNISFAETTLDLWDADFGISKADFAIAETGSLVVSAGPGKQRASSLVPPTNVMLVHRNQIVATLTEAMAKMTGRTSVIVTGPSRTADIEGILVKGVHGPGELLVLIYL